MRSVAVGLALVFVAAMSWAGPLGQVSVSNLDFGSVLVGETADLSVTIRSVGDAVLAGAVVESCAPFSIVSGGGAYSLDPDEERVVVVRFTPASNGTFGCTLSTSSCQCSNVALSGEGYGEVDDPAICDVLPTSLAFGTLAPGASSTQTFRIKNTGGSVLSGTVSESCTPYLLTAGAGAYALAAGESVNVSVKFTAPASDGSYPCTVALGAAILKGLATCSDVSCTGATLTPVAICQVSTASLSFGTAVPDSAVDRSFVVRNVGTAGLSGSIAEGCADFSVTAGSGDFNLAAGDTLVVTVRMQSATEGAKSCTIDTGSGLCSDVSCSGSVSAGGELAAGNFEYLGAFKFGSTGTALGYGAGRGLGILPNGDLVVLGTDLTGYIAVCTPATPIITTNVGAMNTAATVTTYFDPTGGLWQTEGPNSRWEDIVVLDNKIVFTAYSFYDRAYDGRGGMGFLNLSFGGPTGMFWPGDPTAVSATLGSDDNSKGIWYPGKTCGQMQEVPAAYVEGGRSLAMGRSRDEYGLDSSAGPSLYLVDPDDITNAVCALCYDQIGQSGAIYVPGPHSRPDYSLTDQTTDMAWIGSTVLFTSNKCLFDSHYYQEGGSGETGDPGVCDENTGFTCGHAGDALPGYEGHFELYRADDLMAVAHGELNNWDPQPYDTIAVSDVLVDASCSSSMAGVTWDETNRKLYVIQTRKNGDGPVCHVWHVTEP